MKKIILSTLFTLAVLFLTMPYYYRDIVRISFEAQSNRITSVYAFFTQASGQSLNDLYVYREADLRKKTTISFDLPVSRLHELRIAFNLNTKFPKEQRYILMSPVFVQGKERAELFTDSSEKKYTKIYSEKASEVLFKIPQDIQAQKQFYFSVFFLIAAASFLSFWLILAYKTASLTAAAVSGYTGVSFWYDTNFSLGNPFLSSVLAAGLFLFYFKTYRHPRGKINRPLVFLSIIFSLLNFFSLSMYLLDSWVLITNNSFLSAVSITGFSFLFYTAGLYFCDMMDSGVLFRTLPVRNTVSKLLTFYNEHTVCAVFVLIVLCWLPWHVIYYPGMITLDSKNQFKQVLGMYYKSQHHPVLSTFIMGLCLKAGIYLKDNNLGVYFYTFLQSVICAWIFAVCQNFIKKTGARPSVQIACLLFFTIAPLSGSFSVWTIKDILFSGMFTLFVLQTILLMNKTARNKDILLYGLTFFLVCLLRKNGIYCTLPVFLAVILLIIPKTMKLHAWTVFICGTVVFLILTKSVFPALGYREGGKEEMFAIPFQQTARTLRDYPADVSPEEKESIDRVLPFDLIALKYRPDITDPVKNQYKLTGKETELIFLADYFKTWFRMFFKHPGAYFQAAMGNSYKYYAFTSFRPSLPTRQWDAYDSKLYTSQTGWSLPLRQLFNSVYSVFWTVPFLFIFYSCAFYTWLVFLICTYFISRGRLRPLIPLLPLLINIFVCIASPVNGMFRYLLPVITAMPIAFVFAAKQASAGKEDAELSRGET